MICQSFVSTMQTHNTMFFLCIIHKMLYNESMEAKIIRSKRKSISIRINDNGEVLVRCPQKFPLSEISKILQTKKDWIVKCVQNVQNSHNKNLDYYTYKKILLNGKDYMVNIKNKTIWIWDSAIKMKGNNVKKTLSNWLQKYAQTLLFSRLDEISEKLGKNYTSAKLMSARKKWGSCDNYKNIKLNFRLVMLPTIFIDYVCVHELCHTNYMNHSKNFWNEVEKFIPNCKNVKKEMSKYNFVLELF